MRNSAQQIEQRAGMVYIEGYPTSAEAERVASLLRAEGRGTAIYAPTGEGDPYDLYQLWATK